MKKTFYLTTAIDYVNGEPHLGHGYEKVIADVIARSQRSLGKDVFFLTGMDEHGQKVQQAAVSDGKTPQAYCDELAVIWKKFTSTIYLSQNHFVRTTDESHLRLVQAVLNQLKTSGHLYQAEYRGFYSTREETFLTEKDRRPDGTFDPAYGDVTELVEQNYYFKLKGEQQWLIDHIEKNPDFIYPDSRRNEVLGFLKSNPLEDLCVTRPASRLTWGIPVPFDPDFVTYVWFDALLNYISVPAAYGDPLLERILSEKQINQQTLWPADLHIIGKDIIKFHAVYWPILLKALGLPLPKKILVHGWWQKDGKRMSKSLGNGVDPVEVVNEWGVDAFRYYVIRELDIGPDGNWTQTGFQGRYDSELANGLGNLVNRSLSMLKRYRQGVVPQRSDELKADADQAVSAVRRLLDAYHLQEALESIWGLVNRANLYVEQTAPFRLAKDPAQSKRLDEVLYNLVECTRILAHLLWPFLPGTAEKIFQQLSLPSEKFHFDGTLWGGLPEKHLIGEPQPLFPRKDLVPKK